MLPFLAVNNVGQLRRPEVVYTDLEEILNHARSTGGLPDTQDGYGLMISELLGNDFPNCSAVSENINPMHSDIGLHNGEVPLQLTNGIIFLTVMLSEFNTYYWSQSVYIYITTFPFQFSIEAQGGNEI